MQLWYTASKIGNLSFFKKMVFNLTVKAVDNKWLSIILTGAYRVQCILYTVQCTMYSTMYGTRDPSSSTDAQNLIVIKCTLEIRRREGLKA